MNNIQYALGKDVSRQVKLQKIKKDRVIYKWYTYIYTAYSKPVQCE